MIRESKISLKKISQDQIKVLNNACSAYKDFLELLCNTENKSQNHIHHSINREYGYMLLARITRRNIPMNNTITIDVHTAYIASDGLRYFISISENEYEKNAARQLLDELFQELPYTKDIKHFSLKSEA